jgi:hypothetical protein
MRLVPASLLLMAAAIVALLAGHRGHGAPLWPGARHTVEERNQAVLRGIEFMYRFSRTPGYFQSWGHDLIGALYEIATTSANGQLRRTAWRMAHERALEWRRLHPTVPPETGPSDLTNLIWGNDTAERLGVPDPRMSGALRGAVGRFTVVDYLGFDPTREPPPADLPEPCEKCARQNVRGAAVCARCGSKLAFFNRYALFQDALINTSTCDQAGIPLGAHYKDVLRWLPAMRPWPDYKRDNHEDYFAGIYCATHVIYTYNRYSRFRLPRTCFPDEFEHLRNNLQRAVLDKDTEILGEFLDSLRSFGLGFEDASIRGGFDSLLSTQNPDGSWGDRTDPDPYARYHPTWTAIDGLRDYLWPQVLPCPVF